MPSQCFYKNRLHLYSVNIHQCYCAMYLYLNAILFTNPAKSIHKLLYSTNKLGSRGTKLVTKTSQLD